MLNKKNSNIHCLLPTFIAVNEAGRPRAAPPSKCNLKTNKRMKNILSLLLFVVCLAQCGAAEGQQEKGNGWRTELEGKRRVLYVENDSAWADDMENVVRDLRIDSLVLEEGVTKVPDSRRKSYFTKVRFNLYRAKGLKQIGKYAFASDPYTSGTSYVYFDELPEGLEYIGDYAFDRTRLSKTDITLPKGLKHIGDYAFYCTKLESVTFSEGLEYIGNYAFEFAEKLKSVALPKGLKHIGDEAFFRCEGLESVTLPEGLEHIGHMAFSKTKIASITLPKELKFLGGYAFAHTKLESITLPDGLEHLESAFVGTNIKFIKLPKGCKYWNLSEMESLVTVEFPMDTKYIPDRAFLGCINLMNTKGDYDFVLPPKVRSIGCQAFNRCTALARTSIYLPASVDTVGDLSFYNIKYHKGLDDYYLTMYCYAAKPPVIARKKSDGTWETTDALVMDNIAKGKLYVANWFVDDYKADEKWAYDFNIYGFDTQCNPYPYTYTAIRDVEGNRLKVSVRGGVVSVEGVDEFDVYDMSGRKMPAGRPLPAGVYVVTAGTGSARVVVK